jgi:hypothetical protein
MSIRGIARRITPVGYASPTNAPVYIDADDNLLKIIPAGSGTTEVQVVDASSVQTLTNKTLTSPTITGAVVSGLTGPMANEVVAATNVITAAESGKVFFLASATEFVSTLPAPAAGLHFTFIVAAAPAGASYTIVTDASAQVLVGGVHDAGGTAGDVESTAGATTITFVDGQSVVGDTAMLWSDGTSWFARVFVNVAAGATFTG